MARASARYRELAELATQRAKLFLQVGDRVNRSICGGGNGTFKFTGWAGCWAQGRGGGVDCHALNMRLVNGKHIDFLVPHERKEIEAELDADMPR